MADDINKPAADVFEAARTRRSAFGPAASRSFRTRSTIGTMYDSDLPEPVPVVSTYESPACAASIAWRWCRWKVSGRPYRRERETI